MKHRLSEIRIKALLVGMAFWGILACWMCPGLAKAGEDRCGGIAVHFTLKEPGFVTLVIDDAQGVRVRNLISETEFTAGDHEIYWDGLDDTDRDIDAAKFGVYHVPGKVVPAGEYTVRGLVRPRIGLTYELAPYTNGKPAWLTEDKSSAWLTNHSAPQGALFMPAGKAPEREGKPTSKGGQILIGSRVSEGGSGLAWLDLDGNKLHGQEWVGGIWTAATHFARDEGDEPVPGVYAYTAATYVPKKSEPAELRLSELLVPSQWGAKPKMLRLGTGEDRPVLTPHYKIQDFKRDETKKDIEQDDIVGGLTIRNGLLVASLTPLHELLFIDARARKILGTAKVEDPRGLLFDRKGRLWVLSGKRLLRYTLGSAPMSLPEPEVMIAKGLEDPQQLAIDPEGCIYITDWGTSHQVKQFTPEGQRKRFIGIAGVPNIGPYNPLHMNHPAGVAIDDRGRIWVAENDFAPKRVSIWSKRGELIDAFYGPARYGGGGTLDPRDRSVFYYGEGAGGMQFRLDWDSGRSQLQSVYYRAELDPVPLQTTSAASAPDTPIPHDGHTYLTNAFNSNPVMGASSAAVWILENGKARKVAAMGNAWDERSKTWWPAFNTESIRPLLPADFNPKKDALFYCWSDRNGDESMQPDEIVFQRPPRPMADKKYRVGGVTVQKDLSFVIAFFGDEAVRLKPTGFNSKGVPVYDLNAKELLAKGVVPPISSGGGQALAGQDGWSIYTTGVPPFSAYSFTGVREGKALWSYPNPWPGLHPGHNAPMPSFPGQLLAPQRLAGYSFAPLRGEAGELWAVNSGKGVIYLFTMDGLFVATLFQDSRTASWNVKEAVQGMPVDQLSLAGECFYSQIMRMDSGEVYLQVGTSAGQIRIVRVTGLDGIRRLPETKIKVTEDSLKAAAGAARTAEIQRQEKRQAGKARIVILKEEPNVDGKPDDWKHADWVTIDSRRVQTSSWGGRRIETRAALSIAGDRLYGIYQTDSADLLKNAGTSLETLFKTGGGLDIVIGAPGADPQRIAPGPGDFRLLISDVHGKPTAVVYRPVVPGNSGAPVKYISPVRVVTLDQIEDLSAHLRLASGVEKGGPEKAPHIYFEFSIPLARLGLKPVNGQSLQGDLGVLRGDGLQTLQRAYWNNKSSGLVSDAPSEAELVPRLWGTFQFEIKE